MVAQWTEQFLIQRGVPQHDALRLIVYRNNAAASAATATAQGAAVAAASPHAAAAVGLPVTVPDNPGTTARVIVAESGSLRGARVATLGTPDATQEPPIKTSAGELDRPSLQSERPPADASPKGSSPRPQRPAAGEGYRRSLVEILKTGLSVTRVVVDGIKDSLPFPGKEAASLVLAVLNVVDQAVVNSDNLKELQGKALAFLDILDAYHPSLERVHKYNGVIDEYKRLLQGICSYAESYASRNLIMKLFTGYNDRAHYDELTAGLTKLTDNVMLTLAADSNARLQGLQGAVEEAVASLKKQAAYTDHASRVNSAVEAAGGLQAVMADEAKLKAVLGEMDIGQRITIEAITAILSAHLEQGPHSKIRSTELRLFWKRQYPGDSSVPWAVFWQDFPAGVAGPQDGDDTRELAARLARLLSSNTARMAFQQEVGLENSSSVSVYELRVAFSGELDLADEVLRLLERAVGSSSLADLLAPGSGPEAFTWAPAAGPGPTAAASLQQQPATFTGTRLQLPQADAQYTGREEAAHEVMLHLVSRSVVLLAGGGMGKSSLAVDVGWRLFSTGTIPSGALWVDLREARTAGEVEARFCATLGLQRDNSDNIRRIAYAVRKAAVSVGVAQGSAPAAPKISLLLVADNAEDALAGEEASATLLSLLKQVADGDGQGVRVIVTSRVPLGYDSGKLFAEVRLGRLSARAASRVVRSIAKDATETECASVATACACVPLVLRLVSEALVSGRMTMKDMPAVAASGSTGCGPDGAVSVPAPDTSTPSSAATAATATDDSEAIVSAVGLVLCSLTTPHQRALAQLAVFPAAFSEEDAAAVMGCSRQQAAAAVTFLHRQGLVQNSRRRSGAPYIMHATVRQAATRLGKGQDASLRSLTVVRYGRLVLRLLGEWAGMYSSRDYRLAVKLARDRQADVGRLVELLSPPPPPPQQVSPVADGTASAAACQAAGGSGPETAAGDVRADGASAQLKGAFGPYSAAPAADEEASMRTTAASTLWQDTAAALSHELFLLLNGLGLLTSLHGACEAILTRLPCADAPVSLSSSSPVGVTFTAGISNTASPAEIHALRGNVTYFLAHIQRVQGRYTAAEAHAKTCVDARKQALQDDDDPQMAAALYCLGWCVREQGRYPEAEELYKQSWEIRRRVLGDEHPDTAQGLHGMAVCLGCLDRLSEAEEMYKTAIETRRRVLGQDHPDVAHSLNGLASCLAAREAEAEAEPLFREVLEMRQRIQGEEHPDTASSLKNLALCIKSQGRYTEAEELNRRALDLHVRVLGEDHPDTAASVFNLGVCVEVQGRRAEAEELYRRALAICERCLDEAHPYVANALESLAECVEAQGDSRVEEAVALWQKLASLQRRVLGEADELTVEAEERLRACEAKRKEMVAG